MILRHHKSDETSHTMRYRHGKLVDEGKGLDFHYFPGNTNIVSVPIKPFDIRTRIKARSKDMQPITVDIDGIFKIGQPRMAASALDFGLDARTGKYRTDSIGVVKHRIRSIMGDLTRDEISEISAEEALTTGRNISRTVQVRMRHEREIRAMGVHISRILVASIETSPEAQKVIESSHLERYIVSAKVPVSQGMMMATRAWETDEHDGEDITPMDCTENCPFSHMCSDYGRNISNGKARCSLFREFST